MKPHKHAELIKAWADGAEIEFYFNGDWRDFRDNNPAWETGSALRIKPENKWFRVCEFNDRHSSGSALVIVQNETSEKAVDPATPGSMISRWITDRIYYE